MTANIGSFVPSATPENAADNRVRSLPVVVALTRLEPLGEYVYEPKI